MNGWAGEFHFIRPWLLLLAPAVAGVWWFWRDRSNPLRGWREQVEPGLLAAMVEGGDHGGGRRAAVLLAAWLLAAVAAAGPTWRLEPSPFADDASPLVVLLKADVSMETPDPAPSRMERARLKVVDLAAARAGQPLGLVAYSGSAHLVLPPTRDTAVVGEMAAEISPDIMPEPGDRLDLALRKAAAVTGGAGSVVVFADAVDGDVGASAAAARESGMPVQILALNSPGTTGEAALREAADAIRASLVPLAPDSADIQAVVDGAAGAPVFRAGEGGERWEEAGYWMVPLVAVLALAMFRREGAEEG